MTSAVTPWFHHQALVRRFSQSLQQALDTRHITAAQRLWLQRLLDDREPGGQSALQALPRVDQVVVDSELPLGSELSAAWVISDPLDPQAPVVLDTLLNGVEVFANREALNQAITQRYLHHFAMTQTLELQHVEGNPFVQRMQSIVAQQVRHLDTLIAQLDGLPSLRTAIGTQLQHELSEPGVDVFEHCLQEVVEDVGAGQVVIGTQSLVDAAFQDFGSQPPSVENPVKRRFVDTAGAPLDAARALLWAAALAGVGVGLADRYEGLLSNYWNSPYRDGGTLREFAARALAEAFRHELLQAWAAHRLTATEVQQLAAVLFNPVVDPASCKVWQPSLILNRAAAPKLAGVFVLELIGTAGAGLYMFSAQEGLRHFASRALLDAHFRSPGGLAHLLSLTSLNEHDALHSQTLERVRLDAINQPLFNKMLDSIIALQKRNLQHVLSLPPIHALRCAVRVDDALDVRHLLDRRLGGLHDNWRWSSGQEGFVQRWAAGQTLVEFSAAQMDQVMYSPANAWHGQLGTLDVLLAHQSEQYEKIAGCMRDTLNRYLAVCGADDLDARDLWLESPATGNTRLISLTLERVSGHASGRLPGDCKLVSGDPAVQAGQVSLLPVDLLEWMLEQTSAEFIQRYASHLRNFFTRPLRWLDAQIRPGLSQCLILDAALHLELSMERRWQTLDARSLDMFQQMIERPVRSLRQALGDQAVEVFAVQLLYDPQQPALALDNVLVLTCASSPGWYVVWALCSDLSEYASMDILETGLAAGFESPRSRADWMHLLQASDRARLQLHLDSLSGAPYLLVQLQRIDGHVIETLQARNLQRHCEDALHVLRRAQPWKLPADGLRHLLNESEYSDPERQLLDRLGVNMEVMLADALLPDWMKQASVRQLFRLSTYIERWYVACYSSPDYLFGIEEPGEYARNRVQGRFAKDFPEQSLDPDKIIVTTTHYTATPVGIGEIPSSLPAVTAQQSTSLTEYVIGRSAASQDGVISVKMEAGQAAGVVITPDYLRALVRELDVANAYRLLLKENFTAGQPGYSARLKYYTEQVPPLELLRTYAMRIRDELSEEGFRFVEAILTMPEAALRLPVLERDVMIAPLSLQAAEGVAPDRVPGAFIIAPGTSQPGPWLLYTLFNADFYLQEYPDQAALLNAIHTADDVQRFILSRLPASARRLYEHGGFIEPHVPFSTESDLDVPWETPAPVALVIEPIAGNALHALFASTGEVLQWWFGKLSMTNAEEDWAASKFLWTLGAEQILALVPGRLGALVGLWQSHSLLRDSAVDVVQLQWGKAAAELLAAVAVLLTTRRAPEGELSEITETAAAPDQPLVPHQRLSWGNNSLTPELWSRLRPYQVEDLDLGSLVKDPLLSTYKDPGSGFTYASVVGALYRVEKDQHGWFIVGDLGRGPRIFVRDGQWQLNLQLGLRGGGGILTRIKSGLVSTEVDQVLIVEATGMADIRRKFRTHARDIAEAHALAREYLENSRDNLEQRMPDGNHHPRVGEILKQVFDISAPPASLFDTVSHSINQLHAALMDGSLSPLNSERYVIGVRRSSLEEVTAFSFPVEPAKRIYLTERFFRDPTFRLKSHVLAHGQFNQGRHFRATVLIHELSHLYCGTEDLAYIEAHAPFIDLLEDHSEYRRNIKHELVTQQSGLSWRTPTNQLFRTQRADGLWYDLTDHNAKQKIMQITSSHKFEQARAVFYTDDAVRSEVILGNADSVALLVTLLGRERLVP